MAETLNCTYTYVNDIVKRMTTVAKKHFNNSYTNYQLNNFILELGRYHHYNSANWTISAGALTPGIIQSLRKHDPNLEGILKKKLRFTDSNNNVVDFPHLCATLDAYITTSSVIPKEWAGWGGDIATLTLNVVEASKGSNDFDYLISKAKSMLGSNSFSFSKEDINSDIDAENIYNSYLKNNVQTVETAFSIYYVTSKKNTTRFDSFINGLGSNAFQIMLTGPSESIYLGLNGYDGLGNTPTKIQQNAVYGTFADFVFTKRNSSTT